MTKKRIYQMSLATPLLVPVAFLPLFPYLRSMNDVAGTAVLVILYSGLVGGLPYLLLAVSLLIWMRHKTELQIRKGLLLSPLMMLIPLGVCYAIYQFGYEPAETFADTAKMFLTFFVIFGVFTLAFGYFYVVMTLGAASLLAADSED